MSVVNNSELYAIVEAISAKLQRAGDVERSSALKDALCISSVPGEILGETRFQLRELRYSTLAVQLDLEEQIDEALDYLNHILGPG